MSRVSEAILRFMFHERFLQGFEKEVAKGEVAIIDVFLKEGIHYTVRGRVLKGRGTPILSLGDTTGSTAPTYYHGRKGTCFSVIPERDGLYHIRIVLKPSSAGQESTTVAVTLSCALPAPRYICGLAQLVLTDDGMTKGLLEPETTVETHLERSVTTKTACKA
jgi:hypothetical protein